MLLLVEMKIKTDSGVLLTIIPEGSSKLMLFDRPVRVIELKREEISQISALLASNLEMKTNVELQSRQLHSTKLTKPVSAEGP